MTYAIETKKDAGIHQFRSCHLSHVPVAPPYLGAVSPGVAALNTLYCPYSNRDTNRSKGLALYNNSSAALRFICRACVL